MLAGLTAGDPERTARSHCLIQSEPSLQARMFRLMWGGDQEQFVNALLEKTERTRDAELRMRVIAHAVTDTLRVAVTWWLQGNQTGTLLQACQKPCPISPKPPVDNTPFGTSVCRVVLRQRELRRAAST
ncbi:hypothetical protein [Nocardia violaceofusca]|uniref:hypothetical protein n=1 Tax=Nocardia violaceofusca TaxID=941182 RepID=UPI0007A3B6C2|nr:hypothetical protein [Nocardia violaceofusca]